VIKATKAQDDFLFLEDIVSLPEFSSRKSFVTPYYTCEKSHTQELEPLIDYRIYIEKVQFPGK
jgi:hypothetical protein